MAKVLGVSGRYVADQTREKRVEAIIVGLVTVSFTAASAGFLFGRALPDSRISPVLSITIATVLAVAAVVFGRLSLRRMDALEKERLHMQRGADGESAIARILANFPDAFSVINDITTPLGNIDHVVVGPTGVFVIDAKNWRGVVSADGRGELLLNGKPTDKPAVDALTNSVMRIRSRVLAQTPGLDTFFNGLLVFTSTRVEANWGTTRKIKCIRDEQLYDHIVESKFGNCLSPADVQRLTDAFESIARLDPDFSHPASVPRRTAMAHRKPAVALP